MAIGKAVNKNFYTGDVGEIAMPPLDETPPIAQAAPDPWQAQQASSQEQLPIGQVPDQLPDEVYQAMDTQDHEHEDHEDNRQEQPSEPESNRSKQPASDQSERFRDVRSRAEKAERERDAMLSQMLDMQSRMQYQQQQQPQQKAPEPEIEDFDFDDIDGDSLVEGKQLKKFASALKSMKQKMKTQEYQSQEMIMTARIKAQYPDFDSVVSKENVETLNERYPEVARTLRDTPDLYNKAASAYAVIKNFGIHKDTTYDNDRIKAVVNSQKPRPLASVNPTQGDSPLSKANAFANGMTKDLQEQLRREMNAARKAH